MTHFFGQPSKESRGSAVKTKYSPNPVLTHIYRHSTIKHLVLCFCLFQHKAPTRLVAYPGVYDVIDSIDPGQPEIRLILKPEAERLGLRIEELSEQELHAYFGDEMERLQRGRNEVKVMVRYPR